jgi:hypothetical protein
MEFEQAAIALLASMVLVLAGMVGWLYWQQTRMFQNMNSIVMVVGELASRPTFVTPEPMAVEEVQPTTEDTVSPAIPDDEDDRVSVEAEADQTTQATLVEGPDTDDLDGKTKKELQDILVKRGIPFSKGDTKPALISLLKATA